MLFHVSSRFLFRQNIQQTETSDVQSFDDNQCDDHESNNNSEDEYPQSPQPPTSQDENLSVALSGLQIINQTQTNDVFSVNTASSSPSSNQNVEQLIPVNDDGRTDTPDYDTDNTSSDVLVVNRDEIPPEMQIVSGRKPG